MHHQGGHRALHDCFVGCIEARFSADAGDASVANIPARRHKQLLDLAHVRRVDLSCPIFSKFSKLTCISNQEDLRFLQNSRHEAILLARLGLKCGLGHDHWIDLATQSFSTEMTDLDHGWE
jgi:hypothetical protein